MSLIGGAIGVQRSVDPNVSDSLCCIQPDNPVVVALHTHTHTAFIPSQIFVHASVGNVLMTIMFL